jgi:hypothetical protein
VSAENVVTAWSEREIRFRIERNGSVLTPFTKTAAGEQQRFPTLNESAAIDRLVFQHDNQHVALVIPLLRAGFEITKKGEITARMRGFHSDANTQEIVFKMTVAVIDGRISFTHEFSVEHWNLVVPSSLAGFAFFPFDVLDKVTFERPGTLGLPDFARAIGLSQFPEQSHVRPWRMSFVPVNRTTTYAITLDGERQISPGPQNVTPFDLTFFGSEVPDAADHNSPKVRLGVRQPVVADFNDPLAWPIDHWIAEVDVPGHAVLEAWNRTFVERYINALHAVQDGRPVSLVPRIHADAKKGGTWRVTLSLFDPLRTSVFDLQRYRVRQLGSALADDAVSIVPRRVEPLSAQTPEEFDAVADLPAFDVIGGSTLSRLAVRIGPPDAVGIADSDETNLAARRLGFHFSITHAGTAADQTVRVGALNLRFRTFGPEAAINASFRGRIRGTFRGSATPAAGSEPPVVPRLEELSFVLRNVGVRPGGQDALPGEEFDDAIASEEPQYDAAFQRENPLLIDRSADVAGADTLLVSATESAPDQKSQTLRLELRKQQDASPTKVDVIVLDAQPFLVSNVSVESFEGNLSAETNIIANWSNRGADSIWEIAGAADGFELALPPQGVGEAMMRRRGDFARDGKDLAPADFRFSPNAVLELRSSYFRQRFVEAPWNLRRVLGYAGQRGAGAGAKRMRFELLYGLRGAYEPRDDDRGIRVAEVAARLGQIPGKQAKRLPWRATTAQADAYDAHRNRWRQIFPLLLSRLAVLEPYDESRRGVLALTDDDGVSFALRENALLHDPISHREVPAEGTLVFKGEGLKGGWSWGFESANILNTVLRGPRTSSALVSAPAFSALGGWGHQKAAFDRNLTTIYSDAAMGRTFSISIERIGRIGVFWNRAKHVIVYERRVRPTAQFAGEQDQLEGIPVLRKVREYVEILEDDRTYPEFGEAPVVRGFVRGCSFPRGSRRINVNGSWGEDIGTIGWKVPLWRRDADAAVYPRPNINVVVAGDHPDKIVPLTIAEPDKLYFFTNTTANISPNTDDWPAVEGIDFAQLPELGVGKREFAAGTATPTTTAAATPVQPGAGAFTWALDAAPHAVNLVEARTDQPLAALLQNVTMMRGPLQKLGDPAIARTRMMRDEVAAAVDAAQQLAKSGRTVSEVIAAITEAKLGTTFADLTNQLTADLGSGVVCQRLTRRLAQELDRLEATVRHEIVDRIESARRLAEEAIAAVRDPAHDITDEQRVRLKKALNDAADQAIALVNSIRGAAGELPAAIDTARKTIADNRQAVDAQLQAVLDALGNAAAWTEQVRAKTLAALLSAQTQSKQVLAKIESAVTAAGRAFSGPIPDQARQFIRKIADETDIRLQTLITAVRTATPSKTTQDVRTLVSTLRTEITAAFTNIDATLSGWKSKLADAIGQLPAAKDVITCRDKVLGIINDAAITTWNAFDERAKAVLDELTADLESKVATNLSDLRALVDKKAKVICADASAAAADALAQIAALTKDLDQTVTGVFGDVAELGDALERIREAADARLAELGSLAGGVEGAVRVAADKALRLLRAFGDPPHVPSLGFDLPRLGYLFADLEKAANGLLPSLPTVHMTPVIAKANELLEDVSSAIGSALNPISVHLPSDEILDRIIPKQLPNFDLSSIFPNFAGLQLPGLFSNLRLPAGAQDHVKITHGFDQQAMRGWLEMEADVPYTEPTTVFNIAGLMLRLLRARFYAVVHIEASAGQAPRRTFRGEITGDWSLQIGGFEIVTFVDTKIRFDDSGSLRFEMSPDKVKLQAALQFVSNLISKFGYKDSGFSIGITPSGVRSTLDLPLPDIQAGSFGLANLHLGCIFELAVLPDFVIRTNFFLGHRDAPFTITVFILGGAGWVDVGLQYTPASGDFTTRVSIGITASASLAIALGPIKGGIYAYFGIEVEYEGGAGHPNNLTAGLLLLFRGEVSLLGFLSVGLCLSLEALYTSGGGLIGRGHVSYSIKICWCVTINVSADVSYTFGGSPQQSQVAAPHAVGQPAANEPQPANEPPPAVKAANAYVGMFA